MQQEVHCERMTTRGVGVAAAAARRPSARQVVASPLAASGGSASCQRLPPPGAAAHSVGGDGVDEGEGRRLWVEAPLVKGLHGQLPTQAQAQAEGGGGGRGRAREGAGAHSARELSSGAAATQPMAVFGWQADSCAGGGAHVQQQAAALAEVVYSFMRAGGDLVRECVRAGGGGSVATPAVSPLTAADICLQ